MNKGLRITEEGINLIKAFEGIADGNPATVNLDPYLCPAGYWTIGYGHVIKDPSGRMLKGREMKPYAYAAFPKGINKAQADWLLRQDVTHFEEGVKRLVKVPLNVNQFSALVSFSFNVGLDEDVDRVPEGLGDSRLLVNLNKGCFKCVAAEFPKWNKSGGKVLPGLVRRREAERLLFLKPIIL